MNNPERLAQALAASKKIVVFTGAGMSAESGLPIFRNANGYFDRLTGNHYKGEEVLSLSFFQSHPALFQKLYLEHFDFSPYQPNAGHLFLAEYEQAHPDKLTICTQNIDGLHQKAGNQNVIELHGNGQRWRTENGRKSTLDALWQDRRGIYRDAHNKLVRPDIVLYQEDLRKEDRIRTAQAMREADLLLVIGTSLQVFPAANFLNYFSGKYAFLVNQEAVPHMHRFNAWIKEPSAVFFQKLRDANKKT
jgi:NAD-dependent deacetylase